MSDPGDVPPTPRGAAIDVRRLEVVDWDVAAVLRGKSGMERLRLAHEAWELVRDRLTTYFSGRHPEMSQEEIQRQVARRLAHESG